MSRSASFATRANPTSHYLGVAGPGVAPPSILEIAEHVGRAVARAGCVLVCGGLGGAMEAACRGAKAEGGTTVGILPGADRSDANDYVDVAVPSGLGEARNTLVVRASDALIAVAGEFGTLSEIAFALKVGKPVVGLGTWRLETRSGPVDAIFEAQTPHEAVELALSLIG